MRNKLLDSINAVRWRYWNSLVGKPDETPRQNRGFNVVSIFVFLLLAILIPLDWYLGLTEIATVLLVTEGMLLVMYFLSRYRGWYQTGLLVYMAWSYLLITFVFLYNGGSDGPALYFFLLSYQLVIVFASERLQPVGMVLHLIFPVGLLVLEYVNPTIVMAGYESESNRYIDLITSLPIIVISIFLTTRYLRRAYDRERTAAEARAQLIERQSERIRNQNRLLQDANHEKLELISILGHDLRNPLSAITGTLEILSQAELPPREERKLKEDLLIAARNTSDLLNNVLSWVLAQVKGIHPVFTVVEPMVVIDRILDVQRFVAEKKDIAIRVDAADDALVAADMEMLELIIRNLVSNAIKFTGQGGQVTVGVTANTEQEECTIFVRDNGVGMTDEHIKAIFNGQIQSTYGTESEKGIGLGLFLCRELTHRLNGRINVKSEPGAGSTFYLTLPIAHTAMADERVAAALPNGEAYA
ncbi:sensor histidine kinase [Parapedobacter sp. 10938]|uniref:sensor histidine kinase n=1 Tax=Parapedobacter flavus TaxID=3110225 RepID=UPI002DBD41E6|nr:HAMP domain-containing sensor histidine kinase [Parapedobacter sp. 10938]MEC3881599.1 HAMP domain-containing sensor histidine kinase [Parapedobacter sp. 10938]